MTTRSLGYQHTCPRCKATAHTEAAAPPDGWMRLALFTLHKHHNTNGELQPHREPWAEEFASAVFCGPCAGAAADLLGLELVPKTETPATAPGPCVLVRCGSPASCPLCNPLEASP